MSRTSLPHNKYALVAVTDGEPQSTNAHTPTSRRQAFTSTLLNVLLILLPMVSCSAIFLVLIFYYRIQRHPTQQPQFSTYDQFDDSRVYYVSISAATLVFIASWSSTCAGILTSCYVALLSYPLATIFRRQPHRGRLTTQTAPHFCILTGLFAGQKIQVLYQWITGKARRGNRDKTATLGVLGLCLGLLIVAFIIAADSYLHISTKSILLTSASTIGTAWSSSYVLSSACTNNNNTYYGQMNNVNNSCIIMPAPSFNMAFYLNGQGIEVINNNSLSTSVYTYTPPFQDVTDSVAIDHPSYAYVANAVIPDYVDFAAETFAISNTCKVVTSSCKTNGTGFDNTTSFDCGPDYPAFKMDNFAAGTWGYFFFTSPNASLEVAWNGSDPKNAQKNTFTTGFVIATIPLQMFSSVNFADGTGQSIEFYDYELFFLLCDTSVYQASFTYYNGSVVPSSWQAMPTNASVANMVQSGLAYVTIGYNKLADIVIQSFTTPGVMNVDASVKAFASRYSALALSVAAGGMIGTAPIAEQWRFTQIVTEVQRSAVWALVAANMALAFLGCAAFIAAVGALLISDGKDVCEVVDRLTIKSLVEQAVGKAAVSPSSPQQKLPEKSRLNSG